MLGGAAGTFLSYWLAPQQQVRQQHGLDAAQAEADASSPAVLVQDQRYGGETRSEASAQPLDLDGTRLTITADSQRFLPGPAVEVGPVSAAADGPDPARPQVYDRVHFTLVGNHYATVKVTAITARIVDRAQPPSGTLLWKSPQGASDDESIGFDLDSVDLAAHTTRIVGGLPELAPQHYVDLRQVTLTRGEKLEFTATAFTRGCLCAFVLDVRTDDGGVQTVDDGGRPWRVVAFAARYQRAYAVDLGDPAGPTIVSCDWPTGCRQY